MAEPAAEHQAKVLSEVALRQQSKYWHPSALVMGRNFLIDALAAGPRPARELYDEAAREGISKRTLLTASKSLDITTVAMGEAGVEGRWVWVPPSDRSGWPAGQNDTARLQRLLCKKLGLNQAQVIDLAVRELARKEGIE